MGGHSASFPLGIDYHPLDAERDGFADWYSGDVEAHLAAFAAARITLVRVFISWKLFERQVGNYDEEALHRLERVVSSARTAGVRLIVCFFADDRMSDLGDVTWGRKRDPRIDPYLIQRQASLVQRIVRIYRDERAIWAWDLANEAFCTGFTSASDLDSWVRSMRDAVREVDPDRPVMLSIDPETMLRATGIDARNAIDTCEIAVSHATASYRTYAAEGPQISGPATYLDSFLLRSAHRDLPVLVDCVGMVGHEYSAAQEAAAVRCALYSALMNRGAGALLSRWRDVEMESRRPYCRDQYEALVGVIDIDGRAKPVLAEVARFASVSARLDLRHYAPQTERTAVLIPAERYAPLPSMAGLYDPRSCLQAYIMAKEAHLPVAVAREGDPLAMFGVIIVPSAARLLQGTWRDLDGFVRDGGTLVMTYGGGDVDPALRTLFGVDFLGDHGRRSELSCRIAQADVLGALRSFDAPLRLPHFALVGSNGAAVVATDGQGSPLLTLNTYGSGRAIFIAAPVERALAQGDARVGPPPARAFLRTVYAAAANAVGAGPPLGCDRAEVEVALFSGDADDVLLLLNHSPHRITPQITTRQVVSTVADLRGGAPVPVGGRTFGVPMQANGAAALRLTWD